MGHQSQHTNIYKPSVASIGWFDLPHVLGGSAKLGDVLIGTPELKRWVWWWISLWWGPTWAIRCLWETGRNATTNFAQVSNGGVFASMMFQCSILFLIWIHLATPMPHPAPRPCSQHCNLAHTKSHFTTMEVLAVKDLQISGCGSTSPWARLQTSNLNGD